MRYKLISKVVTMALSVMLTFTMMPINVFATVATDAPQTEAPEASEYGGGFAMSEKVDDVVVTVKADEGVFPEDAVLNVKKLSRNEQNKVDAAVEGEVPENRNTALSYSFDIKVLDADGSEIQPAEGQNVEVAFETVYASNPNLEA